MRCCWRACAATWSCTSWTAHGICVAAGSACAAGSAEPSYVLAAMGIDPATAAVPPAGAARPGDHGRRDRRLPRGVRAVPARPRARSRASRDRPLARRRRRAAGRRGRAAAAPATTASGSPSRSTAGKLVAVRFGSDACPTTTPRRPGWQPGRRARSLLDGARLGAAAAHAACGVAGARRACVEVAVDAFHAALATPSSRGAPFPATGRVAVAMSGGVDSAVALAEAARPRRSASRFSSGSIPHAPDTDRACCAPGSVRRARDLCHQRGLPHLSLDLRDTFRDTIVAGFIAGYEAGETPNPCTACNGDFRLHELVAAASRLGAARVRTGHYARIVERDGVPLVARGADQSQGPELHAGPRAHRRAGAARLPARRPHEARGARACRRARPRRGAREGEPGGLLPRRRRLPHVPRPVRRGAGGGPDRGRGRPRARPPRRRRRLHAGQRRGIGVSAPSPSTCCAPSRLAAP